MSDYTPTTDEMREQAAQQIYAALSGHSTDVDEGLCLAAEIVRGA